MKKSSKHQINPTTPLHHNGHNVMVSWKTKTFIKFCLSAIISLTLVTTSSSAIENNLQYKEFWYKTEQLCPDLQESQKSKDIDTPNHPYKSVFRFIDHPNTDGESCILEASSPGPQRIFTAAKIEAIHVDDRPWNYNGSERCDEHIKLRLPEPTFLKRSYEPKIICRVAKEKNNLKDSVTGSLFHPYLWQFPKGKLGLSFSSLNLSHLNNSNDENYFLEKSDHQYLQIVFTTHLFQECNLRVQQYVVDPQKNLCKSINPFTLCGLYNCSEKESILKALGFWNDNHDTIFSNIPVCEHPNRNQLLLTYLRVLIMPFLFLSVFYVTRRVRMRLVARQFSNSTEVSRRQPCLTNLLLSSQDALHHPSIIINNDVSINYETVDLPPPYDSIIDPPSYNEATGYIKSPSSILPPPPRLIIASHNGSVDSFHSSNSDGGVGTGLVSRSCHLVAEEEEEETVQLLGDNDNTSGGGGVLT